MIDRDSFNYAMTNTLLFALAAIIISFSIVGIIETVNQNKKQNLEIYTAYDILYLQKEKGVWIVSSEMESFYKVVDSYYEGIDLIQNLSCIDIDEYQSYIADPQDYKDKNYEPVYDWIKH